MQTAIKCLLKSDLIAKGTKKKWVKLPNLITNQSDIACS